MPADSGVQSGRQLGTAAHRHAAHRYLPSHLHRPTMAAGWLEPATPSQGEATRAAYMLELGQHRPGIPREIRQALQALQATAMAAPKATTPITTEAMSPTMAPLVNTRGTASSPVAPQERRNARGCDESRPRALLVFVVGAGVSGRNARLR